MTELNDLANAVRDDRLLVLQWRLWSLREITSL